MPILRGKITEEEVSYQGARYRAVMLVTDTLHTMELSDDFRKYIGCTVKMKFKEPLFQLDESN